MGHRGSSKTQLWRTCTQQPQGLKALRSTAGQQVYIISLAQQGSKYNLRQQSCCFCYIVQGRHNLFSALPTFSRCSSCCAVSVVDATTHLTPEARWPMIASTARVVLPLLWGPITSRVAPRPRGVNVSSTFTFVASNVWAEILH